MIRNIWLISLHLSRNSLTGKIIQGIGEMKMLEALHLSANRISREVLTSLTQLNFLSMLHLSNNNLSGKIPLSTQLQSFNASQFLRNPQLCGPALPKKCSMEPPVITYDKDRGIQKDEEDRFVILGFSISMGLGFAVGFWETFGTLLFNGRRRDAYFNLLENIKNWSYVITDYG